MYDLLHRFRNTSLHFGSKVSLKRLLVHHLERIFGPTSYLRETIKVSQSLDRIRHFDPNELCNSMLHFRVAAMAIKNIEKHTEGLTRCQVGLAKKESMSH